MRDADYSLRWEHKIEYKCREDKGCHTFLNGMPPSPSFEEGRFKQSERDGT
jgi:hypothetical protein